MASVIMASINYIYIFLAGLLIMCCLSSACSSARTDPTETAKQFLTAIQHRDFETADSYCSESTKGNHWLMEISPIDFGLEDAFSIGRTDLSGDYAMVWYTREGEDPNCIRLHNVEGYWEVIGLMRDTW